LVFWDKKIYRQYRKNLTVLKGDITFPDLGIKDSHLRKTLSQKIHIIYHCAALPQFRTDINIIRKINVDGTRHILDFASQANKNGYLSKVNHISTVYVVGTKSNIVFSEDMLQLGQKFNNSYEQSKYEAEVLIKNYPHNNLNISIFRLSMVIGETKTGKTNTFRLFYDPIKFF